MKLDNFFQVYSLLCFGLFINCKDVQSRVEQWKTQVLEKREHPQNLSDFSEKNRNKRYSVENDKSFQFSQNFNAEEEFPKLNARTSAEPTFTFEKKILRNTPKKNSRPFYRIPVANGKRRDSLGLTGSKRIVETKEPISPTQKFLSLSEKEREFLLAKVLNKINKKLKKFGNNNDRTVTAKPELHILCSKTKFKRDQNSKAKYAMENPNPVKPSTYSYEPTPHLETDSISARRSGIIQRLIPGLQPTVSTLQEGEQKSPTNDSLKKSVQKRDKNETPQLYQIFKPSGKENKFEQRESSKDSTKDGEDFKTKDDEELLEYLKTTVKNYVEYQNNKKNEEEKEISETQLEQKDGTIKEENNLKEISSELLKQPGFLNELNNLNPNLSSDFQLLQTILQSLSSKSNIPSEENEQDYEEDPDPNILTSILEENYFDQLSTEETENDSYEMLLQTELKNFIDFLRLYSTENVGRTRFNQFWETDLLDDVLMF